MFTPKRMCFILTIVIFMCSSSLFSSTAFKLYTEKSLTAVRGRNVSLPCNFSIPAYAVYWYKHNSTGASDDEASLVVRDYWVSTDPVPGFERFSITDDYSLVITNINVHDETTYSCLVVAEQTLEERGYTDLRVIVLAEPLEPIIESCNITAPRRCTYYTNEEEVNLVCELYNVRPAPDLIWILEGIGRFVQENATHQIKEKDGLVDISSQLQVSKSDFEKRYICQAKGEAVNGISSMAITIEVPELPGDITGSHNRILIVIITILIAFLVPSCLINIVLLMKCRIPHCLSRDSKQLVALNEMDEDDTDILVAIAGESHQVPDRMPGWSQQGNYPGQGLKQKTPPALVYFRPIPILGEYQFYDGMSMSVGDIIRTFIITKLHSWNGRCVEWPNYSLGVCRITPHTDNDDGTRHKTKSVILGRGENCWRNTNHHAHAYMVLLGNIREMEFPTDAEIKMFLSFSPCNKCITELDALRPMFSKVKVTFSGLYYIRAPSCDKIQLPCKCIPDNDTFRMLCDLGASPMQKEDWDELINLLTQYNKQSHEENEAHTLTDLKAIRYGEEYREWRDWEDERMIEDYRIMHDKLIPHTPPRPDVQPRLEPPARPSMVQPDDGEREVF